MTQLSERLAVHEMTELPVKTGLAPERKAGGAGRRPEAAKDLLRDALRGARTYVKSYFAGRGAE